MRVLLSDGSGLTARQSATLLAAAGHHVEALSPDPLCLCQFTRSVRQVHSVAAYGSDPFGWLDDALAVAERSHAELVFPTQEQVAVLSLAAGRLRARGLMTAVPGFAALASVQDKVSAFRTLTAVGLPQPRGQFVSSRAELEAVDLLPAFVKTPVGTASTGVCLVTTAAQLAQLAARHEADGVFAAGAGAAGAGSAGTGSAGTGGVLVQQPVAGPLAMLQSVFADGEMVAFHACERVREGTSGGASHKRGLALPEAREQMRVLGSALGWHGALSADVIIGPGGPVLIDINPRLVEPVNAYRSGVDLTGALVEVACSGHAAPQGPARPGVRTHQLTLAVLGAAQHGGRRRDVARELWDALAGRGVYGGSAEELTPLTGDLRTVLPPAAAALATLVRPAAWRHFTSGSVGAYSLTPAAWRMITERAAAGETLPGGNVADGSSQRRGEVRPITARTGSECSRLAAAPPARH